MNTKPMTMMTTPITRVITSSHGFKAKPSAPNAMPSPTNTTENPSTKSSTPATGLIGAPLLGLVFGLGWTPCIGPTLTAIFSLSLDAASPGRGALLGAVYCVGLGIPFVLLALGFSWATRSVVFLKRHIRTINIIGGVMLVVMGTLMVTGLWTAWMYQLQEVIANFVPSL